jgi:hypothetical protein
MAQLEASMMKHFILVIILFLAITPCVAESGKLSVVFRENVTPLDSRSPTEVLLDTIGSSDGGMQDEPKHSAMDVNLTGVWMLDIAGSRLNMALNHSGDKITGLCKSDDSGANRAVAGWIIGEEVYLAISGIKEGAEEAFLLKGDLALRWISGSYVSSRGLGKPSEGSFTVAKLSDNLQGYMTSADEQQNDAAMTDTGEGAVGQNSTAPLQEEQKMNATTLFLGRAGRGFTDVHNVAKTVNPGILPPHFS